MSTQVISEATAFVQHADLPAARPETLGEKAAGEESPFDAVKQQAAAVGSGVIFFIKAIAPEQRKDILNAALPQLVANKKVPSTKGLKGVEAWYKEYFDVLSRIGFVVQESEFAEYTEGGETFEAHEAISDVVKTVLAGAPAAPASS